MSNLGKENNFLLNGSINISVLYLGRGLLSDLPEADWEGSGVRVPFSVTLLAIIRTILLLDISVDVLVVLRYTSLYGSVVSVNRGTEIE